MPSPDPIAEGSGSIALGRHTATLSARSDSTSPSKRPHPALSSAAETNDEAALASLRKRMAGPSSAKAGLALDQEEINRRIYEASKGSAFFENERRADERTTQQIREMLARREHRLLQTPVASAGWRAQERKVEEMTIALEAGRDLSRLILHCDMDMFYAAVELKRDPSLAGKEFGVGSGVLVTASYEARKYGVRSGMAQHIALALCPHLIIVKNDMPSYVSASQSVMEVFARYDENLAQMSLDEAYLDVTPYCQMHDMEVEEVVKQLREEVKERTGLTVSVGIAPNKMLAKIASDKNKPNGQFRVRPERDFVIDFVQDLSVRKVPGIGRVTERILESLGVKTCGDILKERVMLSLVFDSIELFLQAGLGLGSNVVEPAKRSERRSVGREHTFSPTSDVELLMSHLLSSAASVTEDMKRLDYQGKTVTLTGKRADFRRFTRAKTLGRYVAKEEDVWPVVKKLLEQEFAAVLAAGEKPLSLRLLGVRLSSLRDLRAAQQSTAAFGAAFKRAAESSPTKPALEEVITQRQANERPGDGTFSNADAVASSSSASASALDNSETLECPICTKRFTIRGSANAGKANVELNRHIDECIASAAGGGGGEGIDRRKRSADVAAMGGGGSSSNGSGGGGKKSKKQGPLDKLFGRKK